jgi:hypothetical protein
MRAASPASSSMWPAHGNRIGLEFWFSFRSVLLRSPAPAVTGGVPWILFLCLWSKVLLCVPKKKKKSSMWPWHVRLGLQAYGCFYLMPTSFLEVGVFLLFFLLSSWKWQWIIDHGSRAQNMSCRTRVWELCGASAIRVCAYKGWELILWYQDKWATLEWCTSGVDSQYKEPTQV